MSWIRVLAGVVGLIVELLGPNLNSKNGSNTMRHFADICVLTWEVMQEKSNVCQNQTNWVGANENKGYHE